MKMIGSQVRAKFVKSSQKLVSATGATGVTFGFGFDGDVRWSLTKGAGFFFAAGASCGVVGVPIGAAWAAAGARSARHARSAATRVIHGPHRQHGSTALGHAFEARIGAIFA